MFKRFDLNFHVRMLKRLLVLLSLAALSAPLLAKEREVVPDAAVSSSAREIMSRTKPSVVQIKGFFGSNSAQEFHGTGFAVAPGGVLLTNYHVVAQRVVYPDKYRLEYRTPEGKTGLIRVLAIDVHHDLAVVRAEGLDLPTLPLQASVPPKGTRAYSIGFPLDVGLTITEGVANGRVEDAFDARIHYSGAINGGMSGGPALNGAGQVIGINVSGYRYEQLVSFLVPAEHARALLLRAVQKPLADNEGKQEVAGQLRQHADQLLAAFSGDMARVETAGYVLPGKLASFVECNASGDPSANQPVQSELISCGAKAGLYVQQGLYSGDLGYQHFILATDKLDAWRFAHRLSNVSTASGKRGSRKHVGPLQCQNSTVSLNGFEAGLLLCTRAYRNFEGLYDFTVRVVSMNSSAQAFVSHLDMNGVSHEAGMSFIRRYVEAMQWKP